MNFKTQYIRLSHKVCDSLWHAQWCTKYRFNMFRKFKYKSLIEACIRKTCHRHNLEILILKIMPDHIHIILRLPPRMLIDKAVQLIKGGSSYIFFRAHPKARLRYPKGHLWSPGNFHTTIGYSDFDTTFNYIQHQEELHQSSTLTQSTLGNSGL